MNLRQFLTPEYLFVGLVLLALFAGAGRAIAEHLSDPRRHRRL